MSKCSCVYCDDYDAVSSSFCNIKKVKARKTHKCCACHRSIEPGEEYEYVSGIWDGDFDTYKTCIDCLSIRDNFFCNGYYYEFEEALMEHLNVIDGNVDSECIEGLTHNAKARIIDMIDKIWCE